MRNKKEGGFSFLFLREASEPVILSAEGAKDPLLKETIGRVPTNPVWPAS
jgi:hypothetical protein